LQKGGKGSLKLRVATRLPCHLKIIEKEDGELIYKIRAPSNTGPELIGMLKEGFSQAACNLTE